MNAAMHEAAIRQRAYFIWEEQGCPDGREWDHWDQASREILGLGEALAEPNPAKKPRRRATTRIKAALKSAISA
jgi:hypothetical protein